MLTVVTGAAGFIGRALSIRMAETGYRGTVRLVDRIAPPAPSAAFETLVADLTDAVALAAAVQDADVVIHLAALPGGAAEADPVASRRINLEVALALIDLLAMRASPTRLVCASTIAVLGADLPALVDDATPPAPIMTYGAHKLMVEIALADAVRSGRVDGLALRLPGVVARPVSASGLKSAFMSDVFHAIAAPRPYTVPVGPDATMWLMSAVACADALIHGATLTARPTLTATPTLPAALTLPALRVRMADLVAAIAAQTLGDPTGVTYNVDPLIEAQFGYLPLLETQAADEMGFVHDLDLATLVARAVPA